MIWVWRVAAPGAAMAESEIMGGRHWRPAMTTTGVDG